MNFKRNIVITGGAGFIGSHVVRLFVNKYPEYRIINLDKLTYAGNLANQVREDGHLRLRGFLPPDARGEGRRYHPPGGRKPRGPLDQGPVYLRTDECDGYAEPATGCEAVLGKPAGEI